ncbi:transaldolase family protein [Streptomyces sp. NPDC005970]|uniref:transaldolase family protein n=1 Tax=Streptomyces sp. NPDC005970 TaxID=3156723 RepID=UPI003400EA25
MTQRRSGSSAQPASPVLSGLAAEGVSVWLDGLTRSALADGSFATWVRGGAVTGAVLSAAPVLREVRARTGHPYREQIDTLARRRTAPEAIVRALFSHDARWACDLLAPVHAAADGLDGWVCVDLPQDTGRDTPSALAAAKSLARVVNRPNLLIRVPATDAGTDLVSVCAAEGIGVNAALVHSVDRYTDVLDAYWQGLEHALRTGRDLSRHVCVVTVEVADVERAVDRALARSPGGTAAGPLRGRTALALARGVYDIHERALDSGRWGALRRAGARPYRIGWSGADAERPAADLDTAGRIRHVEEIVAWRTAHLLAPGILTEVAARAAPDGDSLTGEGPTAREFRALLRQRGVAVDRLAGELTEHRVRRLRRHGDGLLAAVRETPSVRAYG